MRYPASEKLEIIRIIEQSHLSARKVLDQIGVPRATFYRWYDQYQTGGPEALEDRASGPSRVWNRIPDDIRGQIVQLALEETELSPRELAVRFTDTKDYFVSEATAYRLLKAHDLITSPAFIVMKAASEFTDKTTRPNEMWQTDFTYFKIIGWGWMCRQASRYAFRLSTKMSRRPPTTEASSRPSEIIEYKESFPNPVAATAALTEQVIGSRPVEVSKCMKPPYEGELVQNKASHLQLKWPVGFSRDCGIR